MIIKNRSSHIPTFTSTVVKNIHFALRRTLLNSHIGTGMKNDVSRNSRNSHQYGPSNTCSSRSAKSGDSSVYSANIHSTTKKKNHVTATTMSSRPIASKWSGRMYSSIFHIHTISAIIIATADTPEWIAPMMKYGANIVECQPSTPIATAKSQDTML